MLWLGFEGASVGKDFEEIEIEVWIGCSRVGKLEQIMPDDLYFL